MRRFLFVVAAVAVGVLIGVLVAPHVLPVGTPEANPTAEDLRSQDSVSRESEREATASAEASADATAGEDESTNEDAPTAQATEEPTLSPAQRADRRAGVLDRDIPDSASGDLEIVPGHSRAPHPNADQVRTVRVEVEEGLPIDGEVFAQFVMNTLNDDRSWGHDGSLSFARTDDDADIRVVLASPDLVDQMCAPLRTVGEYSCGRYGHAALNAMRYAQATEEFLAGGSVTAYREYVVNHEVGHLLGHPHRACPGAGEVAPVMQQQTITLDGCTPNAWPAP